MNSSFKPTDLKAKPLDDENDIATAVQQLVVHDDRLTWPKVNRRFIDPIKSTMPKFALFSFIKAPGVEADESGFFGVAKIRGVYYNQDDADCAAEEIIRNVDSTNSIFTCILGHPFPLVCRGNANELTEVDVQKKVESAISTNVREKRNQEQKEMSDINERAENLHRDVDPAKDKNYEDEYIEQRVKLAHLRYTINEHAIKAAECKVSKEKTIKYLLDAVAKNPEYEDVYLERYRESRRKAHIPEDTDGTGFMKYMADPIETDRDLDLV